jgi:FkbM family methyltransferase
MSYQSQVEQDKYLNETYFNNKSNGTFVDVGAHNGLHWSNSKFFESIGWRGICVEPIPDIFDQLVKNRNCICENYAITDTEGIGDFLLLKGYTEMSSGLVNEYHESHKERIANELIFAGGSKETIPVNTIRLQTLLDKHNITYIDYLSIDTEGNELKVLKSIDFERVKVFAITVENNYKEPHLKEYLTSIGFIHDRDMQHDEIYINKSLL